MVEYARIITKSSEGLPTIPPSASHDNGDWSPNDIYENELYMDTLTGFLYTRQGNNIIQLSVDPAGSLVYHDSSMTGSGTTSDPLGLNISTVPGNGLVLTADGLYVNLSGYVPYNGATDDVDLGEREIKAGQFEFTQSPTGVPIGTLSVGKMRWNEEDGTAEIMLKGGNVTLQIGQEQLKRVVNKTGINLQESTYQAVAVSGAQGQRLAVKLAKADSDANSAGTLGIVTENILPNQEGFITTSGEVRNINTTGSLQGETWADGDILYLSPTLFGGITNIKPQAPNHLVVIGYVEYSHAVHGKIFVKIDNGYELEELHNVSSDTYYNTQDNDSFLFFSEFEQVWKRLRLDTLKVNLDLLKTNSTQNWIPVMRIGAPNFTPVFQDSGFAYGDSSTDYLRHYAISPFTGMQEANLILEPYTTLIGSRDPYSYLPINGLLADSNILSINGGGGSAFNPIINLQYGNLNISEPSNSCGISLSPWSLNLYAYSSGINLFGNYGMSFNSGMGQLSLYSQSAVVIQTEEIQLVGTAIFDNNAHTPSGRYLKIYDGFYGAYYYIPLYS